MESRFNDMYRQFINTNSLPYLADYLIDNGHEKTGQFLFHFLQNPRQFVSRNYNNAELSQAFKGFEDLANKVVDIAITHFLPRSLNGVEVEYPEKEANNILGTTSMFHGNQLLSVVFRFSIESGFIDEFEISLYDENNQQVSDRRLEDLVSQQIQKLMGNSLTHLLDFVVSMSSD